jgi:MFS family permease
MKTGSLRALDALNFCNAGIQTGLGPFIAIFYGAVRHWNPAQIGLLIALQSLSGVATQAFMGAWFDETKHKRVVTAIAALTVSSGAVGIAASKSFAVQVVVQLVIGVGVTVFPAATSSFALGLVGKDKLPARFARNDVFTHTGNVVFASIAGLVGTLLALSGIFYGAAVFAAGMAGAVLFIQEKDVDYEAARAGDGDEQHAAEPRRKGFREMIRDRRILVFTLAVVLFNMSNSSTLPLVGQIFSGAEHGKKSASWETALAVLVAEAVMIGVAALVGKKATTWGRKPMFIAAFCILAVRNGLGVASHAPWYLIALQAFDGGAAATYGVLLKLVTADLAQGSGRFNALQGTVQASMALGGFLSNLLFGFVARAISFNASFIGLSAVAVVGGLVYLLWMPETRDSSKSDPQKKEEGATKNARAPDAGGPLHAPSG